MTKDYSKDLIKGINKDLKQEIAYCLGDTETPTDISDYVSSGNTLLDINISNKANGGFPCNRLSEIHGEPSSGKSLIAIHSLKDTQQKGGIGVLIDTENATDENLLKTLGVDINKNFIYAQPDSVESVFNFIEKIAIKTRDIDGFNKIVTIVWDSIAATPTDAELKADYDENTMAIQARKLSLGCRKLIKQIGVRKICLIFINQMRMDLKKTFGDPYITPGGKAVPFHSSVRVRVFKGKELRNAAGQPIGVHTRTKVEKNKIAIPFREAEFDIYFNKGIDDLGSWQPILGNYKIIEPAGSKGNALRLSKIGIDKPDIFFTKDNFTKTIGQCPEIVAALKTKVEELSIINPNSEQMNEAVQEEEKPE